VKVEGNLVNPIDDEEDESSEEESEGNEVVFLKLHFTVLSSSSLS
jgi:hypothetical protein